MSILSIVHVDLSPELKNEFRKSVGLELSEILKRNFLSWKGFFDKFPNYSLCFYIVTKKEVEEIEIKGPGIFKKDKEIEYSLFMPNISYNILTYIDTIFEGLSRILENYGIEANDVKKMKQELLASLNL